MPMPIPKVTLPVSGAARDSRSQASSKVERIAAQLARKVHATGAQTRGHAQKILAGRDRGLFAEALEHAVGVEWLVADEKKSRPDRRV
jgi:hypothetical protein